MAGFNQKQVALGKKIVLAKENKYEFCEEEITLYFCVYCNKEFNSKSKCLTHKRSCKRKMFEGLKNETIKHIDSSHNNQIEEFNDNMSDNSQLAILSTHKTKFYSNTRGMLKKRATLTKENKFSCNQCEKIFDESCNLKTHKTVVHSRHIFICTSCRKEFDSKISCTTHKIKCVLNSNLKEQEHMNIIDTDSSLDPHSNWGRDLDIIENKEETLLRMTSLETEDEETIDEPASEEEIEDPSTEKTIEETTTQNQNCLPYMRTVYKKNKYYICPDCKKSFGKEWFLKRHRLIHTGEKLFYCDQYPKGYNDFRNLQRHIKKNIHTISSIYICPDCKEEFDSKLRCSLHRNSCKNIKKNGNVILNDKLRQNKTFKNDQNTINVSTNEEKVGAKLYEIKGQTSKILNIGRGKKNLKETTSDTKKQKYDQNMDVKIIDSSRKISKVDVKINDLSCIELASNDVMENDLSRIKQKSNQNFDRNEEKLNGTKAITNLKTKTKVYTKNSPVQVKMKDEKTKHFREELETYKCSDCNKSFGSKGNLKRHGTYHSGEKLFNCDQCTQGFSDSRSLKKHINKFHNGSFKLPVVIKKSYFCTEQNCRRSLKSLWSLKIHIGKHKGKKPFFCPECPKSFATAQNLKIHEPLHTSLKILSNNKKHFICDICSKTFTSARIKIHRLTHEKKKPYPCNICSKSFLQNSNLKSHISVVHMGEKLHVCTVCKKCFAEFRGLEIHVRKHTGEKPFPCDVCSHAFRSKDVLTKHKRNKHFTVV